MVDISFPENQKEIYAGAFPVSIREYLIFGNDGRVGEKLEKRTISLSEWMMNFVIFFEVLCEWWRM
jgi:hypothetical protein